MAHLLQAHGYGGIAVFARHAISDALVDWQEVRSNGVLHFSSFYAGSHGRGPTYARPGGNLFASHDPRHHRQRCHIPAHAYASPEQMGLSGTFPGALRAASQEGLAHIDDHGLPRVITCYNIAEWAEGGPGLQPNMQDRFGYLEAVRNALVLPEGTVDGAPEVDQGASPRGRIMSGP